MNRIRNFFFQNRKSEFLKNAAILSSGTIIAQAISVLTAPILTRIYQPVDYDVFGIYLMVSSLVGVFATLQYNNVIITAKEDNDAKSAVWICIVISFIIAIATLFIVLVMGKMISRFLNNEAVKVWLYFAPLSIFFAGWNATFSAWANRTKTFKTVSANRVIASLLVPAVSITIGSFIGGPMGLIFGLLISQVLPGIMLAAHFFRTKSLVFSWCNVEVRRILFEYRNFPRYTLTAEFLNNFINQIPILLFAKYYNTSGVIGNYNLTNRLLGMPIQLISSSFSEVFRQKASSEYFKKGNSIEVFNKTAKALFLLSIIPFSFLFFFGPWIFSTVFGENWVLAGKFSQILAPLFFLRFIVSPLSYMYFIAGRQKEDFWMHIIFGALLFICLTITARITSNHTAFLIVFSALYCLSYLVSYFRSLKFSKRLS